MNKYWSTRLKNVYLFFPNQLICPFYFSQKSNKWRDTKTKTNIQRIFSGWILQDCWVLLWKVSNSVGIENWKKKVFDHFMFGSRSKKNILTWKLKMLIATWKIFSVTFMVVKYHHICSKLSHVYTQWFYA